MKPVDATRAAKATAPARFGRRLPLWCWFATLVLAWCAPVASAAVLFAPQPTLPEGQAQDIATRDFNGDNDPDMAIVHPPAEVSVVLGGPGGSFGAATDYPAGADTNSIAVGDFNGDHDPDLVHTDFGSDTVTVRLGGAGGSFGPRNKFAVGDGPSDVAVGDFNDDNDPDLAVVNDIDSESVPRSISVLLGGTGGSFGPQTQYFSRSIGSTLAIGDFNGDNDPDVVTGNVAVLPGGPGGSFGPLKAFPSLFDRGAISLAVGDFNADGDPDLAAGTAGPDSPPIGAATSSIGVALGGSGISFEPATYFNAGADNPTSLTVRDFNGDGVRDLAFVKYPFFFGAGGGVNVLLGLGNGNFGAPNSYPVEGSPWPIAAADFDGQEGPDIAAANWDSATVAVLLNTGLGVNPLRIAFPKTVAGVETAARTVELKNNRDVDLSLTAVSLAGPDAASFSISDDACAGATLAPGGKCTLGVRFRPEHLDAHSARLEFRDNAVGSPQSVELSGTGASPAALSPSRLSFFSVTSRQTASQTVTLSNGGTDDISVSSVTLGGADATSFATGDDSCTGATVAPGGTCSVGVRFRPVRLGDHAATLEFSDDALGSPQSVTLYGFGGAQVIASPSALRFDSRPDSTTSHAQAVTLTNVGSADVHVSGVALTGTNTTSFLTSRDTCSGATLPAAGTCGIRVRFRPDGVGPKSATLEFSDDAPGSPRRVALSGTGTPGPWLTASAAALKFGHVQVGTTSATKSVTLTNTGSASMDITAISIEGANPANFVDLSHTCTGSLGPDESCTAQLAFHPQSTGEKRATLTIAHTAPKSPYHVELRGTGT
jgi:hypothetical protein